MDALSAIVAIKNMNNDEVVVSTLSSGVCVVHVIGLCSRAMDEVFLAKTANFMAEGKRTIIPREELKWGTKLGVNDLIFRRCEVCRRFAEDHP